MSRPLITSCMSQCSPAVLWLHSPLCFVFLHEFTCLTTMWTLIPEHALVSIITQCSPVKGICGIKTMLGYVSAHSPVSKLLLASPYSYSLPGTVPSSFLSYSTCSLIHQALSAAPFPLPRMPPALP